MPPAPLSPILGMSGRNPPAILPLRSNAVSQSSESQLGAAALIDAHVIAGHAKSAVFIPSFGDGNRAGIQQNSHTPDLRHREPYVPLR